MSNLTIGRKIAAGFLVVLLQALSVGVYAVWITSHTSGKLRLISSEYLAETELAAQIERDLLNARIHFIYFVTIQKEGSLEKGWQRFRSAQQQLPKLRELVARSEVFAGIRSEVDQLGRDFDSYKPVLERIIDVVQSKQNQGPEFTSLISEWARLGGAMVDSAGRLTRRGMEVADESARQASSQRGTVTLAGGCVAGLIIGLALTFFFTRDVTRALRHVILQLGDSAHHLTGAASQIASSAQSLSQGACEQAASLEETSASTEEINSMASKNADNSKSAANSMMEASQRIDEANLNLEQMVESMDEINASSDKISKIIKVIDEIAFQTNILALNAAVEAARAGEAGLGFAVVAGEVRNLAQRCALAARDTAGLIEESITKSNDGKTKLNQVANAVRSITESASRVKTLVEDVKLGSEQQEQGIKQMAKALTEMEKVTQTTAASAEQSASASEELSAQALSLRNVVEELMAMIGEGDRGSGGTVASPEGMFEWSSRFEFGIPEIDTQHKRLFELANRLHSAMQRAESKSILSSLLTDLVRYTETHFRAEERLLQQCHFPDLAAHKAKHDGLTRKVHQFAEELKAGRATVSIELMTFLRDWLYNHILKSDAAYVPTVSARYSGARA